MIYMKQLHNVLVIFQKILFSLYNIKKVGLFEYVSDFSIEYDCIDLACILDIHIYFIKKRHIKQCLD